MTSLAHALRTSLYHEMMSDGWPTFSVLTAAHAAEILLKARIAEEHPLLIFEDLPKPSGELLDFEDLLERGRTIQFHDLPARLWAATGIRLVDQRQFLEFGRLRNSVQHFAIPAGVDLCQRTLEFIFGVLDPFVQTCWQEYVVDHNEDMDHYEHIFGLLFHRKIRFLVSPASASDVERELAESGAEGEYRRHFEMQLARLKSVEGGAPSSQGP